MVLVNFHAGDVEKVLQVMEPTKSKEGDQNDNEEQEQDKDRSRTGQSRRNHCRDLDHLSLYLLGLSFVVIVDLFLLPCPLLKISQPDAIVVSSSKQSLLTLDFVAPPPQVLFLNIA